MALFRKKPIVVNAEQYIPPKNIPRGVYIDMDGNFYVRTIHLQKVYLESGDWILPEPDGVHYYPVKNDIFLDTYDPVDVDLNDYTIKYSRNIIKGFLNNFEDPREGLKALSKGLRMLSEEVDEQTSYKLSKAAKWLEYEVSTDSILRNKNDDK